METKVRTIKSWEDLVAFLDELDDGWVFRGQGNAEWELKTNLERTLSSWGLPLSEAPGIEHHMKREFLRHYRGDDGSLVKQDVLYCLSLMQHHGAPTRLLDWSYSPFVATHFAICTGSREAALWCFNARWANAAVRELIGEDVVEGRDADNTRDDGSFEKMYGDPQAPFVFPDNPFSLHERLIVQQGIFLVPADITKPFVDNLRALKCQEGETRLIKVKLDLTQEALFKIALRLKEMNVGSRALFPGLDGFAKSLGERLALYRDFLARGVGQ